MFANGWAKLNYSANTASNRCINSMTPEQLIQGLKDIRDGKIPVTCIVDMSTPLILHLSVLSEIDKKQRKKRGKYKTKPLARRNAGYRSRKQG